MPFANAHAARINDPDKYTSIRRQNDKFGPGIDVIFGIADGKTEVQTIRFDKKRYTVRRAQAWLKKHGYSATVEAASGESKKELSFNTGVMIALKIPGYLQESLVLPPESVNPPGSTLPKEELHVTLAYLGDISEQNYVREKLIDILKRFVVGQYPIVASLNGIARFTNMEEDGTQAFVSLVDAPNLPQFRQSLVNELKFSEVNISNKHGFTPHITLAYVPVSDPNPPAPNVPVALLFDTIFLAWGEERIEFRLEGEKSDFAVFKQSDGKYRWTMFSSNAFKDRDGEILSEKALREDVDRADREGYYGPLRWWHLGGYDYKEFGNWQTSYATDGLDIGDCDFNMMYGKILIESGTFRDNDVAERVKEKQASLQGSVSFTHPIKEPDKDGVFYNIRRIERSLLPRGKASNPFVRLVVKGVNSMNLADKIKAFFTLMGNEELANKVLSDAKSVEKAAQEAGIAFKELETDPIVEEKSTEETKTSETAVETPETKEVTDQSVESEKAEKDPGDYLVVEDPKQVSTYHLQVKRGGKPDHNLMGAAWAALHGGYRGNKYEGPNKSEAISKLTSLYESEKLPVPSTKEADETASETVETEKAKSEKKPEDKKDEKKPAKDEMKPMDEKPMHDEMHNGEEDEYIGDMKKKDFAEMVMKCTSAVMDQFEQKMMGMMNDRMGKKEVSDAATQKEQSDKLANLEKVMGVVVKSVQELQGDIPKAFAGGYRASQSKDTEITEEKAKTKGAPTADPVSESVNDFMKFAIGS